MTSRHKAKDGNNHSDSSSIQSACSTCHKNLSKNHFWFSSNQHVNYPDAKGYALHCEGIVSFIKKKSFIHQILLFNQDARDVKVYWRDKVSFIWCSAQLIFIQYSLKLRIIWNSSQFIFACDRTSTSHAPFWPVGDFFFLRNIFCLCLSHNACAKLFVFFVEQLKIRFEIKVMIFLVVDQHGEKLQKYLTSKRQGQEWDWLQKMQRWSKQTTTLFSKARPRSIFTVIMLGLNILTVIITDRTRCRNCVS